MRGLAVLGLERVWVRDVCVCIQGFICSSRQVLFLKGGLRWEWWRDSKRSGFSCGCMDWWGWDCWLKVLWLQQQIFGRWELVR